MCTFILLYSVPKIQLIEIVGQVYSLLDIVTFCKNYMFFYYRRKSMKQLFYQVLLGALLFSGAVSASEENNQPVTISQEEIDEIFQNRETPYVYFGPEVGSICSVLETIKKVSTPTDCSPEFNELCKRMQAGYKTAQLFATQEALEDAAQLLEKNHTHIGDSELSRMAQELGEYYKKVTAGTVTIAIEQTTEEENRDADVDADLTATRSSRVKTLGSLQIKDRLRVLGSAVILGNLTVGGQVRIGRELLIGNVANGTGNVEIGNNLFVGGCISGTPDNELCINSNTTITGNLTVTGTLVALDVIAPGLVLCGTPGNPVELGGTVNIGCGACPGDAVTICDPIISGATINGATICGTVATPVDIGGTVNIGCGTCPGDVVIICDPTIVGDAVITGNLNVGGNEVIGGDLTVTGTITQVGVCIVTSNCSSTDNAIARWDLATGKVIQDSVLSIDDATGTIHKDPATTNNFYISSIGTNNMFVGLNSGDSNTGADNSGFGFNTLTANTLGIDNTAIGSNALVVNIDGSQNTALGFNALFANINGDQNTALGTNALRDNTGTNNIGIGDKGGQNLTTADNNIDIGHVGIAGDSGVIRIGTSATHTTCFIQGIRGVTTGIADAITVVIDSAGQLGTLSSSRRFKENIVDMDTMTNKLMELRPVAFNYKKEFGGDPSVRDYGLIAEEVREIYPDLVINDENGEPYTVRYHLLPCMLLNELQKQQREIIELKKLVNNLIESRS